MSQEQFQACFCFLLIPLLASGLDVPPRWGGVGGSMVEIAWRAGSPLLSLFLRPPLLLQPNSCQPFTLSSSVVTLENHIYSDRPFDDKPSLSAEV